MIDFTYLLFNEVLYLKFKKVYNNECIIARVYERYDKKIIPYKIVFIDSIIVNVPLNKNIKTEYLKIEFYEQDENKNIKYIYKKNIKLLLKHNNINTFFSVINNKLIVKTFWYSFFTGFKIYVNDRRVNYEFLCDRRLLILTKKINDRDKIVITFSYENEFIDSHMYEHNATYHDMLKRLEHINRNESDFKLF